MNYMAQCHTNHHNRLHGQVLTGSLWGAQDKHPDKQSHLEAVSYNLSGDPGNINCQEQQHAWKTPGVIGPLISACLYSCKAINLLSMQLFKVSFYL